MNKEVQEYCETFVKSLLNIHYSCVYNNLYMIIYSDINFKLKLMLICINKLCKALDVDKHEEGFSLESER